MIFVSALPLICMHPDIVAYREGWQAFRGLNVAGIQDPRPGLPTPFARCD